MSETQLSLLSHKILFMQVRMVTMFPTSSVIFISMGRSPVLVAFRYAQKITFFHSLFFTSNRFLGPLHMDARIRITNLCALPLLLFYLLAYLALAGLMNLLAQLSDRIIHFSEYNLMPLAFLTKLSNMHLI